MNHQKKLDIVVAIIKEFPEAANDDSILLERYWKREGWDESKSLFYNLSHVTHPETITRRRRQAFNLGLITYTDKAFEERMDAMKNEREQHSDYDAVAWL